MRGWDRIDNAAKYSDVSKRTIRNWLKNGLPYSRMSKKLVISNNPILPSSLRNLR